VDGLENGDENNIKAPYPGRLPTREKNFCLSCLPAGRRWVGGEGGWRKGMDTVRLTSKVRKAG
jgi:hypothetical protein